MSQNWLQTAEQLEPWGTTYVWAQGTAGQPADQKDCQHGDVLARAMRAQGQFVCTRSAVTQALLACTAQTGGSCGAVCSADRPCSVCGKSARGEASALQLCSAHRVGRQCLLAAALLTVCPCKVVDTLCSAHLLQAGRPVLQPEEDCS